MKTRVFFVSDVHGSDRCFRKFVNGGKFYGANVLVLGGDITGKMVIPLIALPDGTSKCGYGGSEHILKTQKEVEKMAKNIRDSGSYPYPTDEREVEELYNKPEMVRELFKKLMKESVSGWMRLAEERLKGTGISCYVSPGNDDFFEIDDDLNSSSYVINPEERVVDIDGGHEMITMGHTNRTPWNSPRELDEDALEERIEKMANQVQNMNGAIFNIHVPPIDTLIDQAPKLDKDLKPVISGGSIVMASAGSSAVRKCIERYQPLVGLHGHIHEARGIATIGRTTCFSPGSDYSTGVLRGLVFDLEGDKIKSYMLTMG